jgi:hypothetical protein
VTTGETSKSIAPPSSFIPAPGGRRRPPPVVVAVDIAAVVAVDREVALGSRYIVMWGEPPPMPTTTFVRSKSRLSVLIVVVVVPRPSVSVVFARTPRTARCTHALAASTGMPTWANTRSKDALSRTASGGS